MPLPQQVPRTDPDAALLALLGALQGRGYHFVTPTPATHARVIARPGRRVARGLTDIFGWSVPFDAGLLDADLLDLLIAADMIEAAGPRQRSRCRVSTLHGRYFLHAAYPTDYRDAVFFGPDSYRFADFVRDNLGPCGGARIVDIGTGAGVGAIVAAGMCPQARVTMTDINPQALRFARINAAFAGVDAEFAEGNGLSAVEGDIDVAIANPPYIVDPEGRAYRDGGDMHGGRLSLDLACEAAHRLSPGGRLLLYTGSAIVEGRDALREALAEAMPRAGCTLTYRELDPDVFGEEMEQPGYDDVDRIAVVGAVATRVN
ncbi:methyltransferase [Sphingoaurantiacus capsulatus]|uniref:Methyltransferase n=1 Tax=Sphingoaurantiacus capsulatus TaxID=1771310 RepID=A0ABV7XDF8_9SPHN